MPTRRVGLATQITLLTLGVAVVAVLLSGIAAVGLARGAAEDESRRNLARQADTVAVIVDAGPQSRGIPATVRLLSLQGIDVLLLDPQGRQLQGTTHHTVLTVADVDRLAAGQPVSAVRDLSGRRVVVEARPTRGVGFVALTQPVAETRDVAQPVLRRLFIALLLGLGVAAVAGAALAQRLARPLQRSAAVARALASGARGQRIEPQGPAEVADVAESLNTLAAALETSEDRQRQFLLSISHELRTPLTAVRGFAEALADGVTTAADVPRAGTILLSEAQRLDRLVSDLLDLARLGAQDFRIDVADVDLRDVVEDAGRVWASRCAGEGVEFRLELPEEPLPVTTDSGRLRQSLDGLLENALRVTPEGAPIVLALRREATAVVVEVRDGGPGLTEDDLRVAFDRSALYDRYRGVRQVGTGVGLALVNGLVRRLGGVATAGHAAEGGACFTVRLPLPPAP